MIDNLDRKELVDVRKFLVKYFLASTTTITIILIIFMDIPSSLSFAFGSFVSLINLLVSGYVLDKALGDRYGKGLIHMVSFARILGIVVCGFVLYRINYVYLIIFILGNFMMTLSFIFYGAKRRNRIG